MAPRVAAAADAGDPDLRLHGDKRLALALEATHSDTYGDMFFATDIVQTGGATGNVGALRTPVIIPSQNPVFGGGVPEPASWAMMIVGLAGVGGLLRRATSGGAERRDLTDGDG